jgi:LAO/AO transport system kinase
MTSAQEISNLAERVRAGEPRAVSRAISAIENHSSEAEPLLKQLFPATGRAYLIGITGSPGTGKSSLVDRLAAHYRKQGKTVGIVAIDPTSPFSGGAILGDRIRMQNHATDEGIFIRSMATRGFLGGLARATADVALLLDAAGKEIILIETVGVGQDEIDIVKLADCTTVVLMPGVGDEVQAIKAGIMEIGDVFVINKSDREGADRFEQQLLAMLQLNPERDGWRPPVVRTVATEDKGTVELAAKIESYRQHCEEAGRRKSKIIGRWRQRLLELIQSRLMERVVNDGLGEAGLNELAEDVAEHRRDPYAAVADVLSRAGLK